ncbi:hypothetical protein bpr_III232 [Butyrivibrio proteoclasticus B316]|uniref:Lipoprotein n=1 Tax=Butyrivibrio proteoclasticus (strain ATCC 51982 / DSM 14932 / B316) TaxID=515622 RepID=E0S3D6_BUTPB|nr:hypothetical protein [Butyrivibrio proteoclasticus]ADL35918.1 hypothetical protein bpr_III232 [Butyrivibrio proteoclasticus B316]
MKNYKLFIVTLIGCAMLTGCGNVNVQSAINSEIERDIVVEFTEDVDITSDIIAEVEAITASSYKNRPYERCFRFEANEASYEAITDVCKTLNDLPYINEAHTEWHK